MIIDLFNLDRGILSDLTVMYENKWTPVELVITVHNCKLGQTKLFSDITKIKGCLQKNHSMFNMVSYELLRSFKCERLT